MDFKKTNITNTPYDNPHIRRILDKEIDRMMWRTDGNGTAVDGFARESFVNDLECFITNDLNPEFRCDYNLEWKDFANKIKDPFFLNIIFANSKSIISSISIDLFLGMIYA